MHDDGCKISDFFLLKQDLFMATVNIARQYWTTNLKVCSVYKTNQPSI